MPEEHEGLEHNQQLAPIRDDSDHGWSAQAWLREKSHRGRPSTVVRKVKGAWACFWHSKARATYRTCHTYFAPLAQWIRAQRYGRWGRRFKSFRARQFYGDNRLMVKPPGCDSGDLSSILSYLPKHMAP